MYATHHTDKKSKIAYNTQHDLYPFHYAMLVGRNSYIAATIKPLTKTLLGNLNEQTENRDTQLPHYSKELEVKVQWSRQCVSE